MRQSMISVLVLLGAASLTVPAFAQQPPSQQAQTRPPADPNERICRDIALTGSRMVSRRFCATRAEWEAREREDRDQTELMQRPMQCSIMGGRHC